MPPDLEKRSGPGPTPGCGGPAARLPVKRLLDGHGQPGQLVVAQEGQEEVGPRWRQGDHADMLLAGDLPLGDLQVGPAQVRPRPVEEAQRDLVPGEAAGDLRDVEPEGPAV